MTPKERREIAKLGARELHAQGGPATKFNAQSARQAVLTRWAKRKQQAEKSKGT